MDRPIEPAAGGQGRACLFAGPRRGFLAKALAVAMGGLAYAVPLVAGIASFVQ